MGTNLRAEIRQSVFTVPPFSQGVLDFPACLRIVSQAGSDEGLAIKGEQDPDIRNPSEYRSIGPNPRGAIAASAGLGGTA
jgi:hypothetical protein